MLFPLRLRRLYIISDNDAAGEGAAASLIDRARADGIEVIVLSPTLDDFNEDLRWLGVHELRAAIVPQLAWEDVARFLELSA
jgi:ABC-type sugar transport system substrate-binding protein